MALPARGLINEQEWIYPTHGIFNQIRRTENSLHVSAHYRDNALMVTVGVPGERWETEFLDDGSVEVETFISDGEIYGEHILQTLFERYADQESEDITFFQMLPDQPYRREAW